MYTFVPWHVKPKWGRAQDGRRRVKVRPANASLAKLECLAGWLPCAAALTAKRSAIFAPVPCVGTHVGSRLSTLQYSIIVCSRSHLCLSFLSAGVRFGLDGALACVFVNKIRSVGRSVGRPVIDFFKTSVWGMFWCFFLVRVRLVCFGL